MDNRSDPTNSSSGGGDGGGFYIEPQPFRWALRLIFITVFLVGSVGNLVVCAAVIRRKRMRTSNNIFTFNLALSDLLTVLIYVPTQMAAFENDHNWPFGNFACQLAYVMIPVCLSASIATLLAITSDRYRAIAFPMRPRLSSKRIRIILIAIWTMSILVALPLVFVAGEVRPAPGQVYCDEVWPEGPYSRIYWISIFVIQYILPLGMICALAVLIALKIRKNSLDMIEKTSHIVAAAVRQRMKQTSKITNMLIALVILYAICMLPQHLVYLCMVYGDLSQFKYRVYVLRFANVFPMANCALNPIAYGTLNKEFKMVFKSFFKCECHTIPNEGSQVDGHFSRSRRFRLAVYKHVDDEGNSVLEYGRKWRRKSSAMALLGISKQNGGAFKARKNSSMGRLKGSFSSTDDQCSPNGNIPRKISANSVRRPTKRSHQHVVRVNEERTLNEPNAVQKQNDLVSTDEEERQNLLPAKETDTADCSETSYSSMSKGSEKSYNSSTRKSSNKSYTCVDKSSFPPSSDSDDAVLGVYKTVNETSNESTEEPEEYAFESMTNSLEWDPMTIGSLLTHNNIDENLSLAPESGEAFKYKRKHGRNLGLELTPSSDPYNPVDNFQKFVSTTVNGGHILRRERDNSCRFSLPEPGTLPKYSSPTSVAPKENGDGRSRESTSLENPNLLSTNFRPPVPNGSSMASQSNHGNKETGLRTSNSGRFEESETPDAHAVPCKPVLNPGAFDKDFLEYIQSTRETTV